MNNEKILDISWGGIIKVGIALLAFYIISLIRDILLLTIFALIVSVLFEPAIEFIQKKGVGRLLATTLVFILIFGLFGFSVYLVSAAFISEIKETTELFSSYFEIISPPLRGLGLQAFENVEAFATYLENWLKGASANILSAIFSVFGGVFAAVYIFFLSFFFSLEEKGIEKTIRLIFPKKYEELALNIWHMSQHKILGWFGTRILSCVFVGLATFVALKIFKVNYALSLGLFAGITNIVPFLGPFLAGLVIVIFALLDDWLKALLLLIIFFLIQQIESNIISPVLTKKFIGLPPALVLISLIVGGKLFGFLGVILALPLFGIIFDFLMEFLSTRKTKKIESK